MKHTRHYLPAVSLVTVLLFLASCDLLSGEDFLKRQPQDVPAPANFFIDEASARQAVLATYNPWARGSHMYERDLVIIFDGMSDDGHWRPSRGESIAQAAWDINPAHENISDYWDQAYASINAANYAIEGIPTLLDKGLTQEQLDPYLAQARFMRGFSYLFLVTFFGEVPLITSPLSSFDEFENPRAPVADVYEQIIADFSFAMDNLPAAGPGEYGGLATKATAAAYLAKTYLYKEDFPAAEDAARTAIGIAEASGYYLIDDYMSIFDIDNEENPELLFNMSYVEDEPEQGNNYVVQNIARDVPPELQHVRGGVGGWGYHLPQRDLYDAYEEGDPRRGYTIFVPGDAYGIYREDEPFTYEYETYNEDCELVPQEITYTAGDTVLYDYRFSTPTGMNVRKSVYNISHLANVRDAGLDAPVMRMADLYLIFAEALAEQGNNEALTWVNKVRARPSVNMPPRTPADGDLVELVRHERRVELAMEGQRLWDLVRWQELKNVFGDGTEVKRHFFSDCLPPGELSRRFDTPALAKYPGDLVLFPIPQRELDLNSLIDTNNPGY